MTKPQLRTKIVQFWATIYEPVFKKQDKNTKGTKDSLGRAKLSCNVLTFRGLSAFPTPGNLWLRLCLDLISSNTGGCFKAADLIDLDAFVADSAVKVFENKASEVFGGRI